MICMAGQQKRAAACKRGSSNGLFKDCANAGLVRGEVGQCLTNDFNKEEVGNRLLSVKKGKVGENRHWNVGVCQMEKTNGM